MVAVGTQLGPYKILAPLGAGGMGEVYRAQDIRLGREVALKVLPERFAEDTDRLARFEREAKAVAALAHPNIVVLHDFGTDQGVTFTVTELLDGDTLRRRLGPTGLSWRKAVEIAGAIADGLAAAHAKGIIHRDVKPDNVFVTADERVKVLDFGLAKLAENPAPEQPETQSYSPAVTKTGTILGTAPYMSPEQLHGRPVDARSDLFSFGCTLYEMVSGKRPFTGHTDAEVTAAILHDDPPELTGSGKKLPLELERIIRRCLEKNPEARFQSARDLAYALRSLLSGTGDVLLVPPTFRLPSQPAVWTAAAAVLLACSAGGVYWLTRGGSSSGAGQPAQPVKAIEAVAILPFANASNDPEAEYLSEGLPRELGKSLLELRQPKVRPLSSTARYKGRERDLDLQEVGRQLNAQAVLTGTVLQRKDRIQVSVELVDVRDNSVLWSQQYESKLTDLQAVQSDIAQQLCSKLRVHLTGEEEKHLTKRYTANPEAYQLYLRGRHHQFKFTQEGMKKAFDYFNQAIEKDPTYALAYAGLADNYAIYSGVWLPFPEALPKQKAAARKAVELDDNLSEAHLAMANVRLFQDYDWPAAEKEIRRSIQLKPNLALAHDLHATYLCSQGQFEEAIAEQKRALDIDPLAPYFITDMAWPFLYLRQYDQAIEHIRKALEIDPNFVLAHSSLGWVYAAKGQYAEAVSEFQKARQLDDNTLFLGCLVMAHGLSGNRDEARKLLEELETLAKSRYVMPDSMLWAYLGLGEKDRAFEWLQKMYDERSGYLVMLKVDPLLDRVRSDPRFADWLRRMNFPP